jgi:hypothetical protein
LDGNHSHFITMANFFSRLVFRTSISQPTPAPATPDDWVEVHLPKASYAETVKRNLSGNTGANPLQVVPPFHVHLTPLRSTDTQADVDESEFVSTYNAANYELASRPSDNEFFDLRSGSKARKRYRGQLVKYYGYRGVNAGQLNKLHYALPTLYDWRDSRPLPETETKLMTKKMLFQEAQNWPRPPKYHRSMRMFWTWDSLPSKRMAERKTRYRDISDATDESTDRVQYLACGDRALFWRSPCVEWALSEMHFDCDVCDESWGPDQRPEPYMLGLDELAGLDAESTVVNTDDWEVI